MLRAGQPRRDTFSKYEQELHPAELFLHENYEMATVDNDIALIKLDKPIKFNDHVRPACLPKSEERLRTGTRCTVYGWGKQGDNGNLYSLFSFYFHSRLNIGTSDARNDEQPILHTWRIICIEFYRYCIVLM